MFGIHREAEGGYGLLNALDGDSIFIAVRVSYEFDVCGGGFEVDDFSLDFTGDPIDGNAQCGGDFPIRVCCELDFVVGQNEQASGIYLADGEINALCNSLCGVSCEVDGSLDSGDNGTKASIGQFDVDFIVGKVCSVITSIRDFDITDINSVLICLRGIPFSAVNRSRCTDAVGIDCNLFGDLVDCHFGTSTIVCKGYLHILGYDTNIEAERF